ncbi:hypothetical protein NL676_013612 [Syzygium grande]|nr:hypothetical protein NL676_013612 [Syzygium grande]
MGRSENAFSTQVKDPPFCSKLPTSSLSVALSPHIAFSQSQTVGASFSTSPVSLSPHHYLRSIHPSRILWQRQQEDCQGKALQSLIGQCEVTGQEERETSSAGGCFSCPFEDDEGIEIKIDESLLTG